ncbi:MAG: CYTH domain-containing protein [Patescibacteria group bacterium]
MKIEEEIKFIIKTDRIDEIVGTILKANFEETSVLKIKDTYPDTKDFAILKSLQGFRKRVIEVISVKNIPSDAPIQERFVYKKKIGETVYEEKITEAQFAEKTKSLKNHIVIEKNRFVFVKDDVEIVVDIVCGVGNLLEIECSKDSKPQQVFNSLGMKHDWVERTKLGATELWLEKNRDLVIEFKKNNRK